MARNTNPCRIDARRRQVADLYLMGYKQADIAHNLGANQATISRDLAALREQWAQANVQDLTARTNEEVARIDRLAIEAWEAFKRSRQAQEKTRTERTGGEDGKARASVERRG
jgi:hypothetical protein